MPLDRVITQMQRLRGTQSFANNFKMLYWSSFVSIMAKDEMIVARGTWAVQQARD
jgi:hypothetical protein